MKFKKKLQYTTHLLKFGSIWQPLENIHTSEPYTKGSGILLCHNSLTDLKGSKRNPKSQTTRLQPLKQSTQKCQHTNLFLWVLKQINS